MNDKKEEKKQTDYTVTHTKKDIVLNAAGNPVPGYILYYQTKEGSTGNIEIPEREYTKEKALKLIEIDVKRLTELL